MATNRSFAQGPDADTVAGNGLLHRRMFLMAGTAVAASVASTALLIRRLPKLCRSSLG